MKANESVGWRQLDCGWTKNHVEIARGAYPVLTRHGGPTRPMQKMCDLIGAP